MQIHADIPDHYIDQLPEDRKEPVSKLRKAVLDNLPEGFVETIGYGMLGYVVPHSLYPAGYHCDPKLPLPFINIASQKNHISVYHMDIYSSKELLDWYVNEYEKEFHTKPDMGKGCLKFKRLNLIPYQLIGKLVAKISVAEWINHYETNIKKGSNRGVKEKA